MSGAVPAHRSSRRTVVKLAWAAIGLDGVTTSSRPWRATVAAAPSTVTDATFRPVRSKSKLDSACVAVAVIVACAAIWS